jgi:hypothetical protein
MQKELELKYMIQKKIALLHIINRPSNILCLLCLALKAHCILHILNFCR